MVPITDIFNITYGNQFDFSKMDLSNDNDGINFICRSSENNGFMAKVEKYNDTEPFPAGLITVTMGGSYLLSSFVQPMPFYTAQNIKILTPKIELTLNQKIYYCAVIEKNRFRYHSHSREANTTFNYIMIPSLNDFLFNPDDIHISNKLIKAPITTKDISLNTSEWYPFTLKSIFNIYSSRDLTLTENNDEGKTPYISSTQANNGVSAFIETKPSQDENTLTVARNGSIGSAFYQPVKYCASPDDIRIFKSIFKFNKYIALFIATVIEKEKYRYAYGRKFGTTRMKTTIIKLPVDSSGSPDWQFMEDYIKTLPYSISL